MTDAMSPPWAPLAIPDRAHQTVRLVLHPRTRHPPPGVRPETRRRGEGLNRRLQGRLPPSRSSRKRERRSTTASACTWWRVPSGHLLGPWRQLLRAVADRILLTAMDGYRPEDDWKQRIMSLALHVREAFGRQPQLAAVWGRYPSSGTGSRLVMEEVLQALRVAGLPDGADPGALPPNRGPHRRVDRLRGRGQHRHPRGVRTGHGAVPRDGSGRRPRTLSGPGPLRPRHPSPRGGAPRRVRRDPRRRQALDGNRTQRRVNGLMCPWYRLGSGRWRPARGPGPPAPRRREQPRERRRLCPDRHRLPEHTPPPGPLAAVRPSRPRVVPRSPRSLVRRPVEHPGRQTGGLVGAATRYGKSPESYQAGPHLRASMIWIAGLTRTT